MSDDLYFTRLRWGRNGGVAKLRGKVVVLAEKPALGFPFDTLCYTPETHYTHVRTPEGRERELRPAEIEACDRFLHATVA